MTNVVIVAVVHQQQLVDVIAPDVVPLTGRCGSIVVFLDHAIPVVIVSLGQRVVVHVNVLDPAAQGVVFIAADVLISKYGSSIVSAPIFK